MYTIIILVGIIVLLYLLCTYYGNTYEGLDPTATLERVVVPGHANEKDPYIIPTIIPNLIRREQCEDIIAYAGPRIADQHIIEGRYIYEKYKQHMFMKKDNEIIKPIIEKVARIVNLPYENAENVLIVRYMPYQYYKEKYDACCDDNDRCKDFIKRGGERVISVVIYLSDGFEGGGTYFKNLGMNFKPEKGGAVLFYSLARNSNKCHPYSLHQQQPLVGGIKWLAHVWFREHKFV